MDRDTMDSIWLEDDHGKLFLPAPVTMLNSATPMLRAGTVQLPPLPPTSFFSPAVAPSSNDRTVNKFFAAFKKLSGQENKTPKRPRPKISTPYSFSHISHVDEETPATHTSFDLPPRKAPHPETTHPAGSGVAFNRTSPQLGSSIPRSVSQPTSLVSSTFTRASVSTMATLNTRQNSTKRQDSMSTSCHNHSNSAGSLEQLARLEKHQISKQCSADYNSGFNFPQADDRLSAWDTPPLENAVRQAWVYEMSPLERHRFLEGISPMTTPSSKRSVQRFETEMDGVFEDIDEDYQQIQKSIDDFKNLFDLGEELDLAMADELTAEDILDSTTPLLLPQNTL